MIRQLFTAAAPSARIASPALKAQIRQPTWQLTKPATPCLSTTRLFSSTSAHQSSPFRLSSDNRSHSPYEEEDRYSKYKPKRQWPPDMSKLSPKHQFRLERKYRRRAALKYARPQFVKGVQLAQWAIIGFVVIYAVLFMNWDTKDTPFDGIRENVFASIRGVFSAPSPRGPNRADEKNESS